MQALVTYAKAPLIFLLLLFTTSLTGQIVNVESRRISTDTTGLNGRVDFNFFANKNQFTLLSMGTEGQLQYKTQKNLFLLLGNANYTGSNTQKFVNNGFLHFRYNTKVYKALRWEAFTQLQYNNLLLVKQRFLLGTGPRLTLLDKQNVRIYGGLAAMYEQEQYKTDQAEQHNLRMSNYISWTISQAKKLSFTGTIYYQPLANHWADYRVNAQSSLSIFLTEKLYFRNTLNFMYDEVPAETAVPKVYNIMAGVGYLWK